MKIVTPKEMARIEQLAYDAGCDEESFMQKAGSGVAEVALHLLKEHQLGKRVLLLCGKGNNAGDAYVAGLKLLERGYSVLAYQIEDINSCSPLCQLQYKRFKENKGFIVSNLESLAFADLIIDGIFGTGFHGKAEGIYAETIESVNRSNIPSLAIDIPSGLNGETGSVEGPAIHASATAFLGLPKQGFFLKEGWNHVGTLRYVDFGLPKEFIEKAKTPLEMLTPDTLKLPKIQANRHKYQAGEVVGVAGSPGMPGAAMLSSLAALRSGAGIVKLIYPKGMEVELSASPYELIRIPYTPDETERALSLLDHAEALYIGPAMGRDHQAKNFLDTVLKKLQCPAVIDADALYHLAEHPVPIPPNSILTPHTGECARLLNNENARPPDLELLNQCQQYVNKNATTLVLKGGPTCIFHPDAPIYICPRGTPALATAGTGDVLTGILAAMLAQGLSPLEAAKTGVYLHAASGENASQVETVYGVIASDIIEHLPEAFQEI